MRDRPAMETIVLLGLRVTRICGLNSAEEEEDFSLYYYITYSERAQSLSGVQQTCITVRALPTLPFSAVCHGASTTVGRSPRR